MDNLWWKDAIVYQIYPRSFQDTDGDGVGDLRGITQRLDYIKLLGADVIWLCPIYASPNADNGYDISDYRAIQPEFGTMSDFDELLREAHARGIRIIMDLVVNHTSDEHEWFQKSRRMETPYSDYYIWRSAAPGRREPNNWGSWFGGSAWKYDDARGEFFLHIFHEKQPDLNWECPEVRREVYDMMRWWLGRGVDGFRMDVISLISKDQSFPDGADGNLSPACLNGPRVHEFLREMRREALAGFDVMTVGETPDVTPELAAAYSGFDRGELDMVFQFQHMALTEGRFGKWSDKRYTVDALRKVLSRWQSELAGRAWNCLFWSNHDQPRAVSRFGDERPEYRVLSTKCLAACMYLLQGTPYIFQGEELGMTNYPFRDVTECRDVETLNAYRELVGGGAASGDEMMRSIRAVSRDNARTPMQWDTSVHAGFTAGTPWLTVNSNFAEINAAAELDAPDSVFNFYRELIAFRKVTPIIRDGTFRMLDSDGRIIAYERELCGETVAVWCNLSADDVPAPEIPSRSKVICNYSDGAGERLRPWECRVFLE
jgi:oligo-1,6-glucosidase